MNTVTVHSFVPAPRVGAAGGAVSEPLLIHVSDGGNLLAALLDAGVVVGNDCGGNAQCATCRVRVHACGFAMPPMGLAEAYALSRVRRDGLVRLACQCAVMGDMTVAVLDVGEG